MSEFDWVEARSNCTVIEVFKQLTEAVEEDLASYGRRHPGMAQACEFKKCGADRFYVGRLQSHRVVFERTDSQIVIVRWAYMGAAEPLMALTVQLNDKGKCVLIDEQQIAWKPWQVRRKALEKTLFG